MTLNIITDWYLNWPGLVIKVQGSINCFQQTTQQQFTMHLTSYLHSMYEVSITYIQACIHMYKRSYTYTAKFVKIAKQKLGFSKHQESFDLGFLQWFHVDLNYRRGYNISETRQSTMWPKSCLKP